LLSIWAQTTAGFPDPAWIPRVWRREARQSARNGNVPGEDPTNPASSFAFALRGLIAGQRRAR